MSSPLAALRGQALRPRLPLRNRSRFRRAPCLNVGIVHHRQTGDQVPVRLPRPRQLPKIDPVPDERRLTVDKTLDQSGGRYAVRLALPCDTLFCRRVKLAPAVPRLGGVLNRSDQAEPREQRNRFCASREIHPGLFLAPPRRCIAQRRHATRSNGSRTAHPVLPLKPGDGVLPARAQTEQHPPALPADPNISVSASATPCPCASASESPKQHTNTRRKVDIQSLLLIKTPPTAPQGKPQAHYEQRRTNATGQSVTRVRRPAVFKRNQRGQDPRAPLGNGVDHVAVGVDDQRGAGRHGLCDVNAVFDQPRKIKKARSSSAKFPMRFDFARGNETYGAASHGGEHVAGLDRIRTDSHSKRQKTARRFDFEKGGSALPRA